MPKVRKTGRVLRWSDETKRRWVEEQVAKKYAARATNPAMQEKIDRQAYELLRERVALFGADWHVNCAIRLPADVQEAIKQDGTDVLLLMLDRESQDHGAR